MSQPVIRKIGHVTFEHHDEFKGDVKITKGDVEVSVSMESLRTIVAEGERYARMEELRAMKTTDLLRIRKLA